MEEQNDNSNESAAVAQETPPVEIDSDRLQKFQLELESNQNLPMAVFAGIVASAISALIWAGITIGTGYQIGFVAIGVGFLVGFSVRRFGKGISPMFGFIGAGFALLGCLVGNLLCICILFAKQEEVGVMQIVASLNLPLIVELMKITFSPIDLLFYGIAVYEGYRFSFRKITEEELANLTKPQQE